MQIPNHILTGWAVSNIAPLLPKERFFCMLAGVLPDLDVLAIILGRKAYLAYHHVLCHNLLFGCLLSIGFALASRKKSIAFAIYILSFHIHLVLDLLGSGPGWTITYAWPFSLVQFSLPSIAWEFNGWQNKAYFALLLAITFFIAKWKNRTFLEFCFPERDRILISWLKPKHG